MRDSVVSGGEQGLLGLAFDPKYATNRFIYVNYTDEAGDTKVVRYRTNGSRAIPGSALVLLSIDQPYANHNGGGVAFDRTAVCTSALETVDRAGIPRIARRTCRACSERCCA